MIDMPTSLETPPLDSSRSALEFIHRLLTLPAEEHTDLNALLEELSAAFSATGAGLATFPEGVPLCIHPTPNDDCRSMIDDLKSWLNQHSELSNPRCKCLTLTVSRRVGGSCLLTFLGTPELGGRLLWLEDDSRTAWSTNEIGLVVMVGQALTYHLTRDISVAPWAMQLDRGLRRQRMEAAGQIVRRLAHDFGNILTGVLGFTELALLDKDASRSPLHEYLSEVQSSARSGAQYINQLRLFARRQASSNRSCNLAKVLTELTDEWEAMVGKKPDPYALVPRGNVQLKLHMPHDFPAIAMEFEALRQVLTIVLDNAREAILGDGIVDVSTRTVQVNAGDAETLFGDVRPGKCLEIRVADSGVGLTLEVQRQLFAEPFFSTKSRKRGFGLAMAYGILSAYHGGLELLPRLEGGTIARLVVPVAAIAGSSL